MKEKLILFESTRYAIRAERLLKSEKVKFKVIPTPRKFSSNCGVAISFQPDEEEKVIETLVKNNLPYEGPYFLP